MKKKSFHKWGRRERSLREKSKNEERICVPTQNLLTKHSNTKYFNVESRYQHGQTVQAWSSFSITEIIGEVDELLRKVEKREKWTNQEDSKEILERKVIWKEMEM